MCEKCQDLDKKIECYRMIIMIITRVLDPQLVEGIGRLIKETEAQKAAFHPEQQK
jgi:hypothetical protein